MTRINTNISALTANENLANSNNMLQTTLTRLSTGLRINSAADDPAGMIAATDLGSNIAASNQAISNSQVAGQMISTADSALSQISSLLTTINGLVTQAANTSSMSTSQIAANQLQIDSSLNAINSIAQTTNFQGQNLLNGSLGFLTSGSSANYASTVQNLQVNQVNMGAAASVPVDIKVTAAATQAKVTDSMTSGNAATATFTLGTGSITIDAPTGGTQFNNTSLQIQQSASVAAGTAVAAYNSTTNTLTVTVNNGLGVTTNNSDIAAAIGADTGFKVDANTASTGVYTSGNGGDPVSSLSKLTATTTDGGVLQINAKDPNSTWDGSNVQFLATGTSATPNVSWSGTPGSGTLTIQVDATGTTSLASIANAINNSTDPNVQKFAASVTTAGNFDPTVDGNSTTAGTAAGATYKIGAATIGLTAKNHGLASNGTTVDVTVSGNSTTAQYDSSTNTLNVTLAANATISAATLNTALTSALTGAQAGDVVAFQNAFTASATGGKIITGANSITATAATGVESQAGTGAQPEIVAATLTDGTNSPVVTMTGKANSAADAGASIIFQEAAPGTTTTSATYDNSGAGTLTVTLGYGQTYSAAQLQTAVNNAVGAMSNAATFNARYGLTYSAAGLSTAVTAQADQTTAGGTNDIAGLGGALAGGGISATFSGGTGSNALSGALVMEVGSDVGQQTYNFVAGTTAQDIVSAINQDSSSSGIAASINASGQLQLNSTNYGSAAYVNVNVVSDAGDFGSNLSATHASGSDIQATVNNVAAIGQGNTVSLDSPNLAFSATLTPGTAANTDVQFNINGGGALFQLGAVVTSSQQARLGIQNVDTNSLGGTVGRLYEIGSGQDASLTNNPAKAGQIVQAALDNITALRGQLGAFQTSTIDTNISTLTDAVTNLTAAQSSIQDADFATESANLSREQILVQSGTTVAGIASSTPANVLSLLQKAAQV